MTESTKTTKQIIIEARGDYRKFVSFCFRQEDGRLVKVKQFQYSWVQTALKHKKSLLWCPIEHGKSKHMSVWLPIWLLAHNPNLRIVIVSNTASQAAKYTEEIRKNIQHNKFLRMVFPNLRPGEPWAKTGFTVRRKIIVKDPSLQPVGAYGAILGARADVIILDDIIDFENSATKYLQDKLMLWLKSSVFTRLTKNARIIAIGTKWTKFDVYHRLSKTKTWHVQEFSAYKDKERTISLWPEQWPIKRLEEARETLGKREFARQFEDDIESTTSSRFDRQWFKLAQLKGQSLTPLYEYNPLPNEVLIIGVDLAAKKNLGADLTVFFVLAVSVKYKQLLYIESGRFSGPEIVNRLKSLHKRYPKAIFAVENNGQQEYIIQFLKDEPDAKDIPVIPFTTTVKKRDPFIGVERIARDMAAGKWIIPAVVEDPVVATEIKDFLDDLLSYDPGRHLPDRMSAAYIASATADNLIEKGMVTEGETGGKEKKNVKSGENPAQNVKKDDKPDISGEKRPDYKDVFFGIVTDDYIGVLKPVVDPQKGTVKAHELYNVFDRKAGIFVENKQNPHAIVTWNTVPKRLYVKWVFKQKPTTKDVLYINTKVRVDKFVRTYGRRARIALDGNTLIIKNAVWIGELAAAKSGTTKRIELQTRTPIVKLIASAAYAIETFGPGWYAESGDVFDIKEAQKEKEVKEEPKVIELKTKIVTLSDGTQVIRPVITKDVFHAMVQQGGGGNSLLQGVYGTMGHGSMPSDGRSILRAMKQLKKKPPDNSE